MSHLPTKSLSRRTWEAMEPVLKATLFRDRYSIVRVDTEEYNDFKGESRVPDVSDNLHTAIVSVRVPYRVC